MGDDDPSLLEKGIAQLKQRGFSVEQRVQDKLEGKGTAYVKLTHDEKAYYLRAKEYVYQGKAPFGVEMVDDAQSDEALLIIYYDDNEKCFVFDPGYVQNYGSQSVGQSKHSEKRPWVEVELSDGAYIDHWLEGDVTPSTSRRESKERERQQNADDTINASLDHFT